MPSFESIEEDFLRISAEVVWATVATVDSRGRPRTRILHPYWEVVDGRPVGWVGTDPGTLPQWKDGPLGGVFAALRLDPWRVMVLTAEDVAEDRWYQRYWREGE